MNKNHAISEKIDAYHGKITGDIPWRYRSWEHCFRFFRSVTRTAIGQERHRAALQLGFYLASWGMYRGSSFLLQYDYTVHLPVIDCFAESRFSPLWERDVGAVADDVDLVPLIVDAVQAVRQSYKPIGDATDTLVTKVLLGTLGCLPACDRFFIDGFTSAGFKYSYLNRRFMERVMRFCHENLDELRNEQARIKSNSGCDYPLMKLVDMYFWQIGYEHWAAARRSEAEPVPSD